MAIVSIVAVCITLTVMMRLCSVLARKKLVSAEGARKLVHVGMGSICLSFPWLFDSMQPVILLAALAVIGIILVRITGLRNQLGTALFSVKRLSIGELVFPIAVAWLFAMYKSNSHASAVYYTIPLLLLTLADTMGAMAGTKFGKLIYKTASAQKSVEGSVAFFVTAYACTFIPLAIFTNQSLIHIALISLILTLFITAVEGISGMGMDNLLIPIGSYFLLDYYSDIEPRWLFLRVLLIVAILLLMIWTRKKHELNGGAILTACLLCFISCMLGGIWCLVACLFILLRHIWAVRNIPSKQRHAHSLDTIISISVPAMTWLTLGSTHTISNHLGSVFFIISLAITISMLHAGTHKFIFAGKYLNNQDHPLVLTRIPLNSLFKSTALGAILIAFNFPLIPLTEFSFLSIASLFLSGICAAVFYRLRSHGVPILNDWITLCALTGISTTIIYYSHAHYYSNI